MSTRTILTALFILLTGLNPPSPSALHQLPEFAGVPSPPLAVEQQDIIIEGADLATQLVIEASVTRFAQAGLALPDLHIRVHPSAEPCRGHMGLYGKGGDKHRIDLCEIHTEVVLHELAHAWEYHSLDDQARSRFLLDVGLKVWKDKDVPHTSRGIERMAYVVAWGLYDQPIQCITLAHYRDDLSLYESVTGLRSPRMAQLVVTEDGGCLSLAGRRPSGAGRTQASVATRIDGDQDEPGSRPLRRSVVF